MYQPTRSVVTGASSGLGAAYARALAARGSDLVLVARRADRLEALAAELEAAHGIRAEVVPADLSLPGAGRALREVVEGEVDTLVNNAGFGTHDLLVDSDPRLLEQEIAVDVAALVDLTRAFLPGMLAAGRGAIVNVASTAAFQPIPRMAVYGAAKAFVLSFTRAVWAEARPHGVKVLAVAPGATRTEFFDVVGTEAAAVGRFQRPDDVIRTTLRALDRTRTPSTAVSGRANAFAAWMTRLVPADALTRMAGRLVERD
ncbi:MAG: SDR family NAD(P)-dependent oxidoreductase [Protaetiibacter sp.]